MAFPVLLPGSRGDVIRTRDLCVPNAALYQAEPRLDLALQQELFY